MSLSSKISSSISSKISKLSSHKYKNIILIILILAILVILYLIISTFFLDNTTNNANRKEPFDSITVNSTVYSIFNPLEKDRQVSSHWDLNKNPSIKKDCTVANNPPKGYPTKGFYSNDEKAICWPGYDHLSSMLDTPQGWSAVNNSTIDNNLKDKEWVQMDLGSVMKVLGVVTQGRGLGSTTNNFGQCVTSYTVKYSNDGNNWINVDNNKSFPGNPTAGDTKKPNLFQQEISTQYIRIYPQTYTNHISMRVAVLVPNSIIINDTLYPINQDSINVNNTIYTVLNPPDDATHRQRSTTFSLVGFPPNLYDTTSSMLDSIEGWSAQTNDNKQWLQFSLASPITITGVITQSRGVGNPNSYDGTRQMITEYQVQYATDSAFTNIINVDDGKTFVGNLIKNDKVGNLFNRPITAQYIRILPINYKEHISMRAGLLAMPIPPPVLSDIKQIKIINQNSTTPDQYIQISRLAVYTIINGKEINIAPSGIASASSVLVNSTADKAIKPELGITSYPDIYHSATNNKVEYWQLLLDKPYDISKIVFYNRGDCCMGRAVGLEVQVFNSSSLIKPFYTYKLNGEPQQTFIASPKLVTITSTIPQTTMISNSLSVWRYGNGINSGKIVESTIINTNIVNAIKISTNLDIKDNKILNGNDSNGIYFLNTFQTIKYYIDLTKKNYITNVNDTYILTYTIPDPSKVRHIRIMTHKPDATVQISGITVNVTSYDNYDIDVSQNGIVLPTASSYIDQYTKAENGLSIKNNLYYQSTPSTTVNGIYTNQYWNLDLIDDYDISSIIYYNRKTDITDPNTGDDAQNTTLHLLNYKGEFLSSYKLTTDYQQNIIVQKNILFYPSPIDNYEKPIFTSLDKKIGLFLTKKELKTCYVSRTNMTRQSNPSTTTQIRSPFINVNPTSTSSTSSKSPLSTSSTSPSVTIVGNSNKCLQILFINTKENNKFVIYDRRNILVYDDTLNLIKAINYNTIDDDTTVENIDSFTSVEGFSTACPSEFVLDPDTGELTKCIDPSVTTTTSAATTTTSAATSTTSAATSTTSAATSTTSAATSTTSAATSTTSAATSTTSAATSTSYPGGITTSYSTLPGGGSGSTVTTRPSPSQTLPNDIHTQYPGMSHETIMALINSGVDIISLLSNKNTITDKGIRLNSEYRSPSTNIFQRNFTGTSNVYSPYLYYNKNSNENQVSQPRPVERNNSDSTTSRQQTTMPQTTRPQSTMAQSTMAQSTMPQSTMPQTTMPQTTMAQTTMAQTTRAQTTRAQTTMPQSTMAQTTMAQTTMAQTTIPQSTMP
jgi:hypothetical protein